MSKRSSKQTSLLGFLTTKKCKPINEESEKNYDDETSNETKEDAIVEKVNEIGEKCDEVFETDEVNVKINNTDDSICNINDIGNFVRRETSDVLEDDQKYRLIKNVWVPDSDYKFPASGKRNLRFQINWINKFNWLAYSELLNGTFCIYCGFFCNNSVGKGLSIKTGQLVTEPFTNYKKALESYRNHRELSYHKKSVIDLDNFILRHENKRKTIVEELDTAKARQLASSKLTIKPIVETIVLCGRQGLALRGHRDSGPISINQESEHNDCNFWTLLRFKANPGDKVLRHHFESMRLNSTYISPEIQNEIINIIGSYITDEIVKDVNNSCGFSVLADETTDVSHKEQLTLCVR